MGKCLKQLKMPEQTEVLNNKDSCCAPEAEKHDSGTDSDSDDSIPKLEDLSQQAQIDAAKKFNAAEAPQPSEMGGTGTTGAAAPQPAIPEDDEDEEVDEEGVE